MARTLTPDALGLAALIAVACGPPPPALTQQAVRADLERSLASERPFRADGGVWKDLPVACPDYSRLLMPPSIGEVKVQDEEAEASFIFEFSPKEQLFDKDAAEGHGRARFALRDGRWQLAEAAIERCR